MRHFAYLGADVRQKLFFREPEEFDLTAGKDLLATALGGTLYSPSIRPDLVADVVRLAARGVMSSVLCLEDSIPDDRVEEGERNVQTALAKLDSPAYAGQLPLLFVRVRTPEHLARVAAQNFEHLHVLTGFVLPKFEDVTGVASRYVEILSGVNEQLQASGRKALYFMPVLESPLMIHRDTREVALSGIQRVLAGVREQVLAVRMGATDLSSAYGLRRSPDLTIYDVHVIASMIADIVNVFGRADGNGYTVTGAVWEHFEPGERLLKPQLREGLFEDDRALRRHLVTQGQDNFIKEVLFDQSNGITGKTIIHPSHIAIVHSLSVVTHEQYSDAQDILRAENAAGGAKASTYNNKMNEVKPHLAWAHRTLLRTQAFGVANEGKDFVDFLEVSR